MEDRRRELASTGRASVHTHTLQGEAAPELLTWDAAPDRPVAVVFGREDTGLLNEELDRCDRLLVVPTTWGGFDFGVMADSLTAGTDTDLAESPDFRIADGDIVYLSFASPAAFVFAESRLKCASGSSGHR